MFREPSTAAYERGMAHLKKSEYAQAVAAFSEAIQLEPEGPNPYLGRALAHRSLGEAVSAAADERRAAELGGVERGPWHRLVNRAYQRARTGDLRDADRSEFYRRLGPVEREAVLLWELNSQVVNGGFPQWVFNGYAAWIDDVSAAVEKVGTDPANRVHQILQDVSLLANRELESQEQRDENLSKLLECTDRYYAVMGEFGGDVEAWLDARLRA